MTKTNSREKSFPANERRAEFMKSLRRPALIIVFILINIVVIAITAINEFGNSENAAALSEVKISWWFLIPALLCFVFALVFEVYKYVLMIREMSKGKAKYDPKHAWKVSRRTVLLGKYYDSITPAAIGGQPFQVYYMRKNSGLSDGVSTSIPVFGMISGQLGFMIIAVFCFLIGSWTINNAALIGTACFGLIFYAFWPVVVMIGTFLPNTTTDLINLFVGILAKIRIVKNKEKAKKKIRYEINEYARCVKTILKTPGLFAKTILCSLLYNALIGMIPFFVLTAFGGQIDFLPCFVTTIAVTSAVYFVPTPGNSGAAEGTFYAVFSAVSSGYVFWAMLVWRLFSYYSYIIMGPIIYFRMHLEKKRNERNELGSKDGKEGKQEEKAIKAKS